MKPRTLAQVIPQAVYEEIRQQYREASFLDEEDFDDLRAAENSLTGVVASALRRHIRGEKDGIRWETRAKIVRGNGPAAPEGGLGADLVIEINVRDDSDRIVARKVALAQAKIEWSSGSGLREQLQAIETLAPNASIFIDYRSDGCMATTGSKVVSPQSEHDNMQNTMKTLGLLLADEFMPCLVGRQDLHFDVATERLWRAEGTTLRAVSFHVGKIVQTTVYSVQPEGNLPAELSPEFGQYLRDWLG